MLMTKTRKTKEKKPRTLGGTLKKTRGGRKEKCERGGAGGSIIAPGYSDYS